MDKGNTQRQKKTQRSNEMGHRTVKNVCNGFFVVGVLTMMRKNNNKTLNNICASVWSQWEHSESKGKVGQLSK